MLFSIDRIVGSTAVLIDEQGKPLEVPVSMLPTGALPGQMLYYEDKTFRLAPQRTAMRRETIASVLGQLLARGDEERAVQEVDELEDIPDTNSGET